MTEGNFRLRGNHIYLTYAKSGDFLWGDITEMCERVFARYGVQGAVGGRESHQDGTPHWHVLVVLERRCDLNGPRCCDLGPKDGVVLHGKYESARSIGPVLGYVTKDGNVECYKKDLAYFQGLSTPDRRGVEERKRKLDSIVEGMREGRSLVRIARDDPDLLSMVVMHGDKLTKFYQMEMMEQLSTPKKSMTGVTPLSPERSDLLPICEFLKENLIGLPKRTFRQKHLWIWGPRMMGKSTLANALAEAFRVYSVPTEEFYDLYEDGKVDVVIFEEFHSGKPITWMNQFLDGALMTLRQKGKQTLKARNVPSIVLSNLSPFDCYKNMETIIREAFVSRFVEVHVSQFIELKYEYKD